MKRNNLLSWVGIFLLVTTLMALSCRKDKKNTEEKYPSITSFTVATATMTTATFSVNVINYTALSISIDGGTPVSVGGSSYTASGLTANKNYVAVLTATNGNGVATTSVSFTTAKSSLAINSFLVSDTLANSATFNFTATSDATITTQSLINDATKVAIDITGKTSQLVYNLNPNTNYSFTYTVKDNTGNEASSSVTFKTKEKDSEWFSILSVTYGEQFAIIGNAVSNKLTIKVNNSAGVPKVFDYLAAGFGQYGVAVKMLRYSLNGGSWARSIASNDAIVAFTNLTFQPGDNTFECYFSLKPNVGGVPNNSPLSFSFIAMHDREGGTLPKGGSFPGAVAVGSVDASVQPTIITTSWNGYYYGNTMVLGPSPNFSEMGLYQAINIRATGPAGAKFAGIRLKNPYTAFTGLEFNNNSWVFANWTISTYANIINYIWQNEFISLTLPNENNSNLLTTDAVSYNNYYVKCGMRSQTSWFDSAPYTPGEHGLLLTSKYDLIILNSNNQRVDMSDVVVKHGDIVLQN